MRKVLSFSLFLMLGLVASQLLPGALGTAYPGFKATADTLLYICLGFIMINVGREFEIDKTHWRSYTADYFIAMATAALPWLLIVLYYIFVLLPSDLWADSGAWKENLLLSRFAAPTSAGILFTMLAALHLQKSWALWCGAWSALPSTPCWIGSTRRPAASGCPLLRMVPSMPLQASHRCLPTRRIPIIMCWVRCPLA